MTVGRYQYSVVGMQGQNFVGLLGKPVESRRLETGKIKRLLEDSKLNLKSK